MSHNRPLVFACSGCSNAGALADDLAREFDRRGVAEMSCLAGVGAGRPVFLKKLIDREVWVIDGCPIACSRGVFEQLARPVDVQIGLQELGVKKHGPLPDAPQREALIGAALAQAEAQRGASAAPCAAAARPAS